MTYTLTIEVNSRAFITLVKDYSFEFFFTGIISHFSEQFCAFMILLSYVVEKDILYEGISKSFRKESIKKYTLTFGITRSEATQRVMAAKLTRLTHKIVTQLLLVADSCTICSTRSRRQDRKLLVTLSQILRVWVSACWTRALPSGVLALFVFIDNTHITVYFKDFLHSNFIEIHAESE
jgi:hypothetical protein